LVEVDGVGGVASVLEHGHGFWATGWEDDVFTDTHGVAGEAFGFGLGDEDASVFFYTMGDGVLGIRVECCRVVH